MSGGTDIVFITGGGSGIGRGLAEAFATRGAKVIIGGQTRTKLEAVASAFPGMEVEEIDVSDAGSVTACAERVAFRHPGLNMVINNAGIQRLFDFSATDPHDPAELGREIDVNLKGLIMVTNAFLPVLKRQPSSRLVHIGSGLGYVPLAAAPIYSATKAAVHSFTMSLRRQLRGGPVKVIEIIPPIVETGLHRDQTRKPPRAMKLETFVAQSMAGLASGREEIAVGLAGVLRVASRIAPGLFLNIVNKTRD